jgi:hypothetical protein
MILMIKPETIHVIRWLLPLYKHVKCQVICCHAHDKSNNSRDRLSDYPHYEICNNLHTANSHDKFCKFCLLNCLFVCLFTAAWTILSYMYLAAVVITGYRTSDLYISLALMPFNSAGSLKCHTYCNTGYPL